MLKRVTSVVRYGLGIFVRVVGHGRVLVKGGMARDKVPYGNDQNCNSHYGQLSLDDSLLETEFEPATRFYHGRFLCGRPRS